MPCGAHLLDVAHQVHGFGQQRIPRHRLVRHPKLLDGQRRRKSTGVHHLQPVREEHHLNAAAVGVVSMHDGVDDRLHDHLPRHLVRDGCRCLSRSDGSVSSGNGNCRALRAMRMNRYILSTSRSSSVAPEHWAASNGPKRSSSFASRYCSRSVRPAVHRAKQWGRPRRSRLAGREGRGAGPSERLAEFRDAVSEIESAAGTPQRCCGFLHRDWAGRAQPAVSPAWANWSDSVGPFRRIPSANAATTHFRRVLTHRMRARIRPWRFNGHRLLNPHRPKEFRRGCLRFSSHSRKRAGVEASDSPPVETPNSENSVCRISSVAETETRPCRGS